MMTDQGIMFLVIDEGHAAVRTFEHVPIAQAEDPRRIAATVEEQHRLLSVFQTLVETLPQ